MKRYSLLLLFYTLTITISVAQQPEEAPLGINLEGYEYPHPVKFYTLHSQGQKLNMAYMYEQSDASNGKTIMLVHGKNFNGAYWGPVIDTLLARGYDVVVPDQIGFGKSSKPAYYHYTFHQLGKNTKALLDSLGIDESIVLGHSMGG